MNLKILYNSLVFSYFSFASSQTETQINKTDQQGRKQGHWIKKYPNDNVMYDGFFKDDHPVGEFRRFFENQSLKSTAYLQ